MKQTIYLLAVLVIVSCGQSKKESKVTAGADTASFEPVKVDKTILEGRRKQSLSFFEKATLYTLTDTISADFNGDGAVDKAFYKKENENSGIIIIHGGTGEEVRIGFGKAFSTWSGDNECDWVDYMGLVEDKETSESVFSEDGDLTGTRKVKLQHPSIFLSGDEAGGGLITFIDGKYVWIHQSC